ncbi:MAG: peptidase C39 [Oscillospiraceae bacterium]|nr:peptidase C39 [Oscillospiraceae bacterium]
MKIPLRYQITEYDCGPTSLLNALSCLFEREELPPELVRNIMLYSLDCYGSDGRAGKNGTSHAAMMFLSNWLEGFGKTGQLEIQSSYITGEAVNWSQQGQLRSALARGGVAVVRVDLECWHYILITGVQDDMIYAFDPYLIPDPFPVENVQTVSDPELKYNRIIPADLFEQKEIKPYSFGPYETREAVLIFNSRTMLTEENTVEYVI